MHGRTQFVPFSDIAEKWRLYGSTQFARASAIAQTGAFTYSSTQFSAPVLLLRIGRLRGSAQFVRTSAIAQQGAFAR